MVASVGRIAASPRFVVGRLKTPRVLLPNLYCLPHASRLIVIRIGCLLPRLMFVTKGLRSPQPSVASVCNVLSFDSSPTGLLRGL